MFDAGLPRIGGGEWGNRVRHMADKANTLFLCSVGDRKIGGRLQSRLHFDEIRAIPFELTNSCLRFRGALNDDGRLERRRIAIQVWPGEINLRSEALAGVNFLAKFFEGVEIAAHI